MVQGVLEIGRQGDTRFLLEFVGQRGDCRRLVTFKTQQGHKAVGQIDRVNAGAITFGEHQFITIPAEPADVLRLVAMHELFTDASPQRVVAVAAAAQGFTVLITEVADEAMAAVVAVVMHLARVAFADFLAEIAVLVLLIMKTRIFAQAITRMAHVGHIVFDERVTLEVIASVSGYHETLPIVSLCYFNHFLKLDCSHELK